MFHLNLRLCLRSSDAQEFLRFLLDGLHEELNAITGHVPYVELKDVQGECEEVF